MSANSDPTVRFDPAVNGLAAGQRLFGRYELRRKLGEGGFGSVWLAFDAELEEDVALKFVLSAVTNSPEAIDALKREAARSRRLSHPNIVRIHDFVRGEATQGEQVAGISMEFIDGESLGQRRLRQLGRCFDVPEIVSWVEDICRALTYAHDTRRRIIHRDLKPANLLLAADGELKVADFGIACSLSNSMSQISGRLGSGTPPYMSPQQLMGGFPTESDDVYALGATIYTLLTGTPPFFSGELFPQILHAVCSPMAERRLKLSVTGKEEIDALWEETVAACLAKAVEDRPQRIAEVAERLGLLASNGAARNAEPLRAPVAVLESEQSPPEIAIVEESVPPLSTEPTPPDLAALEPLRALRLPFPLIPKLERYRWGLGLRAAGHGFIDGVGGEVIPAVWQSVHGFHEGLAAAEKGGRWGYVDAAGEQVLAGRWLQAWDFSGGLARVRRREGFGYIAMTGGRLTTGDWEDAADFKENLAAVQAGLKWGFIDPAGELRIAHAWDEATEFSEGLAAVQSDGERCFIDPNGERVLADAWEDAANFTEGLAAVRVRGLYGFIDVAGRVVLPPRWPFAASFAEGRAAIKNGGKYGFIDKSGELVMAAHWWEAAGKFSGGLAKVKQEGKWGLLNRAGALKVPAEWDEIVTLVASDGATYFRLARLRPGVEYPKEGESAPAEVHWQDSSGRRIWSSPASRR